MLKWKSQIIANHDNNVDSKLGVYFTINPSLITPHYTNDILELNRINLTGYRTGSHALRIETGRYTNPITQRENRLSLYHCYSNC